MTIMTKPALALSAALILFACGQGEADSQPADGARPAIGVSEESPDASPGTASDTPATADRVPGTQAMVMGAADAPVSLVEYASVTCPHCAAYHNEIFPILKEYYIEPGLVRFEFREFPTAPPQLSYLGSSIARCAAAQKGTGAYFAMIGNLFEHQQDWVSQNYEAELSRFVTEAELTEPELLECINSDPVFDVINENVRRGMEEDGIKSTPSFMLAGSRLEDYDTATYEGYFEKIDAALIAAGATPPETLPPLPEIIMAHGHDHDHDH